MRNCVECKLEVDNIAGVIQEALCVKCEAKQIACMQCGEDATTRRKRVCTECESRRFCVDCARAKPMKRQHPQPGCRNCGLIDKLPLHYCQNCSDKCKRCLLFIKEKHLCKPCPRCNKMAPCAPNEAFCTACDATRVGCSQCRKFVFPGENCDCFHCKLCGALSPLQFCTPCLCKDDLKLFHAHVHDDNDYFLLELRNADSRRDVAAKGGVFDHKKHRWKVCKKRVFECLDWVEDTTLRAALQTTTK